MIKIVKIFDIFKFTIHKSIGIRILGKTQTNYISWLLWSGNYFFIILSCYFWWLKFNKYIFLLTDTFFSDQLFMIVSFSRLLCLTIILHFFLLSFILYSLIQCASFSEFHFLFYLIFIFSLLFEVFLKVLNYALLRFFSDVTPFFLYLHDSDLIVSNFWIIFTLIFCGKFRTLFYSILLLIYWILRILIMINWV